MSPESPTNSTLYFLGLFSGSSMNLYKNVPGKKFYYSRKCMGTLDVYNHAKKGELILKTPGWLYSKNRCIFTWFKWLFFLGFFPSDISSSGLFSCDLISWGYIGSPYINLGKKVPGIKNTGFFRNCFLGTFLHRFTLLVSSKYTVILST